VPNTCSLIRQARRTEQRLEHGRRVLNGREVLRVAIDPNLRPFSRARQVIARHPVAAFLIMVYGVNIGVAFPPFLTRRDLLPFDLALYDSLGHILGSALPAFLVVAAVRGRAGVHDLAKRSLRWRVGIRWYVLALLGVPIATVLAATALLGPAPLDALADKWPLLFTQVLPQLLLLILFFNLAEEIGWTGFLFARLQDRYRPLKASAIVAVPVLTEAHDCGSFRTLVRTKRGPGSAFRTDARAPIRNQAAWSPMSQACSIDSWRSTFIRRWATETDGMWRHARNKLH